jgi:hypothetical protein
LTTALHGCVLLAGLSTYWFLGTFFPLLEEFSVTDIYVVFGYLAACLLIECGIVLTVHWLLGNRMITITALALLLVVNVSSLNLILNESFILYDYMVILAVLTAGFLVAISVVKAVLESSAIRYWVFVALLPLIAGPAAIHYFNKPIWAMGKSRHVNNVAFVQKPNVYFIGFESMGAAAVLRRTLGFKNPELPNAFERNDFRVFRNLFTEAAPTTNSMTSLLALDSDYAKRASRIGKSPLFSGRMMSPLIEIFKSNGYTTTTLYDSTFFGKRAGPYVDEYRFNELFSICTFMEPYEVQYAFFGACRFHELWRQPRKLEGEQIDFLMHAIEEVSRRPEPQFLFAHISPLTHSPKNYTGTSDQMKAFREKYAKHDAKAAKNLDRIAGYLRTNDPTALLFVFGDHGAWLSRNVSFEEDKIFYIQDRYAIMGGVRPSGACASSFAQPISEKYTTTPQVARMLIRCLAGGRDAFDSSYRHPFPSGLSGNYEDYMYE